MIRTSSNDRTREFIVGFDRQVGTQMAVGASYIWRKYDNFLWTDRLNWSTANYREVAYTATTCPAGARCEPITYFEPTTQLPSATQYANRPDRYRDFNGFEVTFTKRMANRWSMNASYAYNNAVEHFGQAALEDPTCVADVCLGDFQYAPESAGSGIGNVFQNTKWLAKASGRVQLPWEINFAGNVGSRQGFPFPQSILTPNRANGGGQAQVLLDPIGDVRYDNTFMIDFRVDRPFTLRHGDADPGVRPVQRDEQQHRGGAEPPAGGRQRQHGERHPAAARGALRHHRSLVDCD